VGLAVRKYVLQRRGVLATAVMRKPAPAFTPETRADVDYLLARLAKRDTRALEMAAE
jgi:4-hydroxy-tetrahydrodipicolinate synthase